MLCSRLWIALPAACCIFAFGSCSKSPPKDAAVRHYEKDGGFSFVPPKGWSVQKQEGSRFKMFMGPGRPPPGIFSMRDDAPSTLESAVETTVLKIRGQYDASRLIEQVDFSTADGRQGKRLRLESESPSQKSMPAIRQLVYIFVVDKSTFALAGSAPVEFGDKFDRDFDACAKSYQIEKP